MASLTSVRLTPDLTAGVVRVEAQANTLATNVSVEVVARFKGQEVGRARDFVGGETVVTPDAAASVESPDDPFFMM